MEGASIESIRSSDEVDEKQSMKSEDSSKLARKMTGNQPQPQHATTTSGNAQEVQQSASSVWYCPSRWLMAHHDAQANIYTLPSHMCLADLNNDGESLLALIDFKHQAQSQSQSAAKQVKAASQSRPHPRAPYDCRLRVYRGQQLIYNHFLDDMPSCLLATSNSSNSASLSVQSSQSRRRGGFGDGSESSRRELECGRALLTLAINDDVYFYHKLKASHRFSLEDDPVIVETLNRSEFDAWKMVQEKKVDVDTLRELLISLSNELGPHESLTSHSNNFLALRSNKERQEYLLLWKFKHLSSSQANKGEQEHLMSMDTICCAAARFRYTSNVTRSGDFGQTRSASTLQLNSVRWNRVLDIQKDGLILGTEDRHLLIYELRANKSYLETNYRLPSTPDHILVERRSPTGFAPNSELKSLTYKILISCRNCRIYSIDQNYLVERMNPHAHQQQHHLSTHNRVNELLSLKCNVLDMCWIADEPGGASIQPSFVAACLDRHIYCFSSANGQCKWVVEVAAQITSLVSLPIPYKAPNEFSLIGVALQSNRIDFYVSQSGRIVDSIYFNNDYCQAMTFGRFGREDNCLCLTTKHGHLLIFILKRTAKFANGQCLSSAASHASELLSNLNKTTTTDFQQSTSSDTFNEANNNMQHQSAHVNSQQSHLRLSEAASLPSAFDLTKSSSSSSSGTNPVDQMMDLLQSLDHNCDQVIAKSALDAHLQAPLLQIPSKTRDFVDQIMEQSNHSTGKSPTCLPVLPVLPSLPALEMKN